MSITGYTNILPFNYSYPQIGNLSPNIKTGDDFNREAINPTNAIVGYTIAGVGTPATTINTNLTGMNISTSGAINDNNSTRYSIQSFSRISQYINPRNTMMLDITLSTQTTTSTQGFIGFVNSGAAALTAIPTTVRHMGLFWDTSGTGNYTLSSSDGTTQVTTDTSTAIVNSIFRLNIIWTGDNTASISFFSSTANYTTLIKSVNVSALGTMNANRSYSLQFFNQTLANAVSTLNCQEWQVQMY